jgi:3-hydroxyacyl-CoA dehydrogenase
MLFAYRRQTDFLLEQGALPSQIDSALREFGFAMGPYQAGDLAGLDISWRIRKRLAAHRAGDVRYSAVADRLCEMGRFGQKSGAGWYRYEPGSRVPLPDPVVECIVAEVVAERGIQRRAITADEIVERSLAALVNEGAHVLEEGIASNAADVDVIWLNGYGFARRLGGPMFWAGHVSLRRIASVVDKLHREQGAVVRPSTLLRDLADRGARFSESDL